jgi:hypothetical protein
VHSVALFIRFHSVSAVRSLLYVSFSLLLSLHYTSFHFSHLYASAVKSKDAIPLRKSHRCSITRLGRGNAIAQCFLYRKNYKKPTGKLPLHKPFHCTSPVYFIPLHPCTCLSLARHILQYFIFPCDVAVPPNALFG